MADKLMQPTWDPLVLAAQLQKIAKQSQTLMQHFVSNQPDAIKLGIGDTSSLGFDFFNLMTKMMTNPAAVASAQIDLFNDTSSVWQKNRRTHAHAAHTNLERRMQSDPEFRRIVSQWRDRLADLESVAAPIEPSSNLWKRMSG